MRGIVLIVVEGRDTRVAPSADSLIGRKFLGIPELTHITCGTAIKAIDITVAIGTGVAGQSNVGIALCKEGGLVRHHRCTWVLWSNIQIVDARTHTHQQCK